jgi:RNA polymerase sigma-70 factor (ECF subfamily)
LPRSTRTLVERLFAEQYTALLAFLQRRLKGGSAHAPDLAQEVYLRMLRLNDVEAIRNPEAYLFTVASNIAKEQAVMARRDRSSVGLEQALDEPQLQELPALEHELDADMRLTHLREALAQLPPKCRAAVLLQYRHGLSQQEVAERLGISTHMVKKYVAQALVHCRRRLSRFA